MAVLLTAQFINANTLKQTPLRWPLILHASPIPRPAACPHPCRCYLATITLLSYGNMFFLLSILF
ncbi:hypothetical protein E2C01_057928 [Portunus trituberculatus]|uniref:Uncharacterized protein n=1 Tax=Portunus trituberculatus TaxID=210409 RepID=A0A5B7GYB0_PORTR|nr:hypothetical protein [Portunus trituberculatus]